MSNQNNSIQYPIDESTLNKIVNCYVEKGFSVVSQTDTSVQLVRKKSFSCLLATILFLLAFLPFFIYLFYYLGKKDQTIFIQITNNQKIKITNHKGKSWEYDYDIIKANKKPPGRSRFSNLQIAVLITLLVLYLVFLLIIIANIL